jgi:hypothetical protein
LTLIPQLMGKEKLPQSRYFNSCREKRNITDYDLAGHITESEVAKLVTEAKHFKKEVLAWLKKHHPALSPLSPH